MPDDRPLRLCAACGILDDHPRHTIGLPPDHPDAVVTDEFMTAVGARMDPATAVGDMVRAVAILLNPRTTVRHVDCCAALGCELCQATEAITGGLRGQDLIDHLETDRAAAGPVVTLDTDNLKIGVSNG